MLSVNTQSISDLVILVIPVHCGNCALGHLLVYLGVYYLLGLFGIGLLLEIIPSASLFYLLKSTGLPGVFHIQRKCYCTSASAEEI